MSFQTFDIIESFRKRSRLIMRIGIGVFLLVALITFVFPRKYEGDASLLFDLSQTDPTDDAEKMPAPAQTVLESIIGTQQDVLRSALVVEEVARRAGMVEKTGDPKTDNENLQDAVKELRDHLTLDNSRQSNVITVSYLASTPEDAAKIANLFVDTFIAKQVELRAQPARGDAKWFNSRTAEVRSRYEKAQKRLTDFQRAHGIIGVDRMDLEAEKMKALSAELATAEADAAAAQGKAGSSNQPEVASALSVQGIQQQLATQSAYVSDLAKTLGPNHPTMLAAKAQLHDLEASLAQARSVQASALSGANNAAATREADLKARVEKQQQIMISMSGIQDDLAVLQRDVDASKQSYDLVRAKYNEAELKSEISQANGSILDHASVPLLPAKPNFIIWLAAGVILAGLSSFGTALVLELFTPRVRSVTGLANATDVPVISDFSGPQGSLISPEPLQGATA